MSEKITEQPVDVEALHGRCQKLSSNELIDVIFQLQMIGHFKNQPKLEEIMKTYLYRALRREGIR